MGKSVYISHTSQDQRIVSLFVDLLLCKGSGIRRENIICSAQTLQYLVSVESIKSCDLFIMMVSEQYRANDICLNEMGAAWAREDLSRIVLLLPGVTFDEIGWLRDLRKKGIQCADDTGLDSIHDLIMGLFEMRTQTAMWNYYKSLFIQQVTANSETRSSGVAQDVLCEEEFDLLDIREQFDRYSEESNKCLRVLSNSTKQYGERMRQMTSELNSISSNPKRFRPEQIREVFLKGARATDEVAEIFEHNAIQLRANFGKTMKFGIMLQRSESVPDDVKDMNREEGLKMVNAMMEAREELKGFRQQLNQVIDIDKSFKNAKNRLKAASDKLLEVFSFCINQAMEFQMS